MYPSNFEEKDKILNGLDYNYFLLEIQYRIFAVNNITANF